MNSYSSSSSCSSRSSSSSKRRRRRKERERERESRNFHVKAEVYQICTNPPGRKKMASYSTIFLLCTDCEMCMLRTCILRHKTFCFPNIFLYFGKNKGVVARGLTPQMKIIHCLIIYKSKSKYQGHTSGNTAAFHSVI